jgi:hypothetical protein
MLNVPVVMLVAAAVVLAGVVYVATGRGGELAFFQADYAPLKMDEVTSTDVALLRPPTALWGYNMHATDEALSRIASAITERDIEISALQQQVADLEAAAGRPRGYGPEASSRGGGRPARRRDRPSGPPEPDVFGSAPPPDRPEPGVFGHAPPPDRPEPDMIGNEADDPDIVLPDRVRPDEPRRAEELGDPVTRPTMPWVEAAERRKESSTEWAALPKRPAAGDDDEDGR